MTKTTAAAFITEFGKRIKGIKLDNGGTLFLNYEDSPKTDTDLRTQTIGDGDFLVVTRIDPQYKTKYEVYHSLESVISFIISETDDGMIDPLGMK